MGNSATDLGIVVGVDGSSSSNCAIQWAAHEAEMRNVPLTVVHVVVTPAWGPTPWLLVDKPLPVPAEEDSALEETGRKIIAEAIKIAQDSAQHGTIPKINSELFFSVPVSTLVNLSMQAQLVVVGSRGQNAMTRVLLGSVSNGLLHHAHCPVAVIHDGVPSTPESSNLPVMVGVDGSPASELATEIAFDEASRRGVDLVALHGPMPMRPRKPMPKDRCGLACLAVEATGVAVKIETAVLRDDVDAGLIAESNKRNPRLRRTFGDRPNCQHGARIHRGNTRRAGAMPRSDHPTH
jgi:nucleotide-binding universal stress UspA family protein